MMNANYTHLDKIDDKTLFTIYLKPVADTLLQFIYPKGKTLPPALPVQSGNNDKWASLFKAKTSPVQL
jgi:hypothetical protein